MTIERERFEWVVTAGQEGARLDHFLTARGELGTRSQVQRLIEGGCVEVDGRRTKAGARLRAGQRVSAVRPRPRPLTLKPEPIALDVIYEDETLLAINKPAGLVVHPAPGHWEGTVVNALLHRWSGCPPGLDPLRPGIVHRLDKDTSGVLVVAKNLTALAELGRQFRRREVKKSYLALAWGSFRQRRGVIREPIGRHRVQRKKMAVRAGGREAVTRYEVLESFRRVSLVRLNPETGRTHQIRVHLATIGHPVVRDLQYARGHREVELPIERHALHAESLSLRHPADGRWITMEARLPRDFSAALCVLRGFSLTSKDPSSSVTPPCVSPSERRPGPNASHP